MNCGEQNFHCQKGRKKPILWCWTCGVWTSGDSDYFQHEGKCLGREEILTYLDSVYKYNCTTSTSFLVFDSIKEGK